MVQGRASPEALAFGSRKSLLFTSCSSLLQTVLSSISSMKMRSYCLSLNLEDGSSASHLRIGTVFPKVAHYAFMPAKDSLHWPCSNDIAPNLCCVVWEARSSAMLTAETALQSSQPILKTGISLLLERVPVPVFVSLQQLRALRCISFPIFLAKGRQPYERFQEAS